jgi:hypothetical protein
MFISKHTHKLGSVNNIQYIFIPIQWAMGAISLGVRQLGCEADHLPLSTAKVKNVGTILSLLQVCLHGVVLN